MGVEIAVEHEWIGRCERTAGADKVVGGQAALAELIPDGHLIMEAKDGVHLFAVKAGGKLAALGERPSAGVVGVVALVELESADADVDERLVVIGAKSIARLLPGKVGHEAAPDTEVAGAWLKGWKQRR